MKETTEKQIKAILEGVVLTYSLGDKMHTRIQDDHDGTFEGSICAFIGPDGDMWIGMDKQMAIRFRNWTGGGRSLRTHNALRILAEAIRLDNLEDPQIKE
jgi:hypothetical protein